MNNNENGIAAKGIRQAKSDARISETDKQKSKQIEMNKI